jgi:acetyltransferase-like isoleucine patch superfamily enzyme
MHLKDKIKSNPRIREFVLWTISPKRNPRPRRWVRILLNPFFHKRGKGSLIRRCSRIDVFPWHRFEVGKYTTIEDYCTVNNGAGDVILGNNVRIGIGSVLIGPVMIGNGAGLGQHVFISGFNHDYKDGNRNSSDQGLDVRPTVIGDETHIGANSVVVAGVRIGKRCQVGAGSVVTKDIPDFSIVVGNPARVIKTYDQETKTWKKTS